MKTKDIIRIPKEQIEKLNWLINLDPTEILTEEERQLAEVLMEEGKILFNILAEFDKVCFDICVTVSENSAWVDYQLIESNTGRILDGTDLHKRNIDGNYTMEYNGTHYTAIICND